MGKPHNACSNVGFFIMRSPIVNKKRSPLVCEVIGDRTGLRNFDKAVLPVTGTQIYFSSLLYLSAMSCVKYWRLNSSRKSEMVMRSRLSCHASNRIRCTALSIKCQIIAVVMAAIGSRRMFGIVASPTISYLQARRSPFLVH